MSITKSTSFETSDILDAKAFLFSVEYVPFEMMRSCDDKSQIPYLVKP